MYACGLGARDRLFMVRAREEKLTAVSLRPWSKVIQSLPQTLQFCGAASYWCRVCIILLLIEAKPVTLYSLDPRSIPTLSFDGGSFICYGFLNYIRSAAVSLFVRAMSSWRVETHYQCQLESPGCSLTAGHDLRQVSANMLHEKKETFWLLYTNNTGHCITEL